MGKECTGGSSDNLMVVRIWPYGVDGPYIFFYGEATNGGRKPD